MEGTYDGRPSVDVGRGGSDRGIGPVILLEREEVSGGGAFPFVV